jgi:hypothetical protein
MWIRIRIRIHNTASLNTLFSSLTELQLLEGGGQAGDGRLSHAVGPAVRKDSTYRLVTAACPTL